MAGNLGGFIEKEDNLNYEGDFGLDSFAMVSGNAKF